MAEGAHPLDTPCTGGGTYQLIRSLVFPAKPTEKSFSEIVQLVHAHLLPAPSSIVQRFKFFCRSQQDSESVSHFVVELRKLSECCEFWGYSRRYVEAGHAGWYAKPEASACKGYSRIQSDITFIPRLLDLRNYPSRMPMTPNDLRLYAMEVLVVNKKWQDRTMPTSNCYRCHETTLLLNVVSGRQTATIVGNDRESTLLGHVDRIGRTDIWHRRRRVNGESQGQGRGNKILQSSCKQTPCIISVH